jgi:hypothetical protein
MDEAPPDECIRQDRQAPAVGEGNDASIPLDLARLMFCGMLLRKSITIRLSIRHRNNAILNRRHRCQNSCWMARRVTHSL